MKRILSIIGWGVIAVSSSAQGGAFDCLWGGANEETSYTAPYTPGMGGVTLAQLPAPPINLGAPPPGQQAVLPVQASPNTQATLVPQSTIPTITVPTGPVGAVGRPATPSGAVNMPQLPPGTELVYVLPGEKTEAECLNGVRGTPATASKIVAPGTPGAIPVAVKTINVLKPKVEYRWTYSPVRTKTETLVNVVNPRTGKVVRSYCEADEEKSALPWLHREEVVSYETVQAKVGTPISLVPSATNTANTVIRGSDSTIYSAAGQQPPTPPTMMKWQSQYGTTPNEGNSFSTVIIP